MAMFYGIPMHIIHVRGKVPFIADEVFPKTVLPQSALPFGRPAARHPGGVVQPFTTALRDNRFDDAPTGREISIAFRQ